MVRAALVFVFPLLSVGCLPEAMRSQVVPENPFAANEPIPPAPVRAAYTPAAQAVAARVDLLGRKLVADNPQMGLHPQFVTIGAPQAEVFHRGTSELDITEGLVKQCTTDGQLAAILCRELGKMVAERETLAAPRARQAFLEPPPEVPVGNTHGSFSGDDTMTALAEQAKFHPPAFREPPAPPPDPDVLARDFLTKAGFPASDLEAAAPLLKSASGNTAWEKQLAPAGPVRPWVHN